MTWGNRKIVANNRFYHRYFSRIRQYVLLLASREDPPNRAIQNSTVNQTTITFLWPLETISLILEPNIFIYSQRERGKGTKVKLIKHRRPGTHNTWLRSHKPSQSHSAQWRRPAAVIYMAAVGKPNFLDPSCPISPTPVLHKQTWLGLLDLKV